MIRVTGYPSDLCVSQVEALTTLEEGSIGLLTADTHPHRGSPWGSVIATKRTFLPTAIGLDIGAGVCAVQVKTTIASIGNGMADLITRFARIRPVQPSSHPILEMIAVQAIPFQRGLVDEARRELGWLDAFGHVRLFVDLPGNTLWIVCMTGSMGFGRATRRWVEEEAGNPPHFPIPVGSALAMDALDAIDLVVEYATENRRIIVESILKQLDLHPHASIESTHNTASWEILSDDTTQGYLVHAHGTVPMTIDEPAYISGAWNDLSCIVEGVESVPARRGLFMGPAGVFLPTCDPSMMPPLSTVVRLHRDALKVKTWLRPLSSKRGGG